VVADSAVFESATTVDKKATFPESAPTSRLPETATPAVSPGTLLPNAPVLQLRRGRSSASPVDKFPIPLSDSVLFVIHFSITQSCTSPNPSSGQPFSLSSETPLTPLYHLHIIIRHQTSRSSSESSGSRESTYEMKRCVVVLGCEAVVVAVESVVVAVESVVTAVD